MISFLTRLIPKELYSEVNCNSIRNMQDAANSLQWSLFDGLSKKVDIKAINVLPISSYPKYYKKPFIRGSLFCSKNRSDNINIGFSNIVFLRNYSIRRNVYKSLKTQFAKDNPDTLILYTVSENFLIPVNKILKKYPSLRVYAIVADMPNMTEFSKDNSKLRQLFTKHNYKLIKDRLHIIDGYVLLTEQMNKFFASNNYVVMEGIVPDRCLHEYAKVNNKESTIIFYSGTLHEKFGIMDLVNQFTEHKNDKFRLWICGNGDSVENIKKISKIDNRIEYFGQLSQEENYKKMLQASILVNPRRNEGEYTKYSFPSKTLEYLATGKPVVCYKLDGIPSEYDNMLFYANPVSKYGLYEKIEEVASLSFEFLLKHQEITRNYVIQNKTKDIQCEKIIKAFKLGKE